MYPLFHLQRCRWKPNSQTRSENRHWATSKTIFQHHRSPKWKKPIGRNFAHRCPWDRIFRTILTKSTRSKNPWCQRRIKAPASTSWRLKDSSTIWGRLLFVNVRRRCRNRVPPNHRSIRVLTSSGRHRLYQKSEHRHCSTMMMNLFWTEDSRMEMTMETIRKRRVHRWTNPRSRSTAHLTWMRPATNSDRCSSRSWIDFFAESFHNHNNIFCSHDISL